MDLGWLWHGLIGFGTTAAVVGGMIPLRGPWWAAAIPFLMPPLFTLGGYIREWRQHADDDPVFNTHRHIEAVSWGIGSLLAALIGLVFLL